MPVAPPPEPPYIPAVIARLLFAMLLLAVPAAVPAAAPAQTLSGDAEAGWVPFTLTAANHLRFAMTIDGVSAQALLDTGLNHSAVSRAFARRAKLTIDPNGAASGVALGGAIRVDWAATKAIAFGALSRSGGRVAVIELPQLLASASGDAEVLVGTDLIGAHALDIDFANRRFRLLPSGRMPFAGTKVPMTLQNGSGLYLTEAMLGRHRVRPLLVDTGDGGSLSIARSQWRAAGIKGARVTSTIAFGAGGVVDAGLTVTDRVTLGGQPTGPIELRIEGDGGFTRQVRVAGRVGTGLLLRYRVLLDPTAGQMVVAPNPQAPPPPLKSTSGLLLGYDRARLRVLHVMAGGPAAKAGWKANELICTVDGRPVALTAEGTIDVRWGAGAAGRVVRLALCDGVERSLTLANFY